MQGSKNSVQFLSLIRDIISITGSCGGWRSLVDVGFVGGVTPCKVWQELIERMWRRVMAHCRLRMPQ